MSTDSEDRLGAQAEAAQRATPGGDREVAVAEPVSWRQSASRALDRFRGLPAPTRMLLGAALAGVVALVPFFLPYLTAQPGYWMNILTEVGIAALLALGLNVVVGFAGLLDLGYVAF